MVNPSFQPSFRWFFSFRLWRFYSRKLSYGWLGQLSYRYRCNAIYFDKEHINSLEEDVEFQLTIYASMAQEESKTISSNVKWGVRSRMKRGERKMVVKSTLGYDYENGKIVIKEQEAETKSAFSAPYSLHEFTQSLRIMGFQECPSPITIFFNIV